MRPEQVVLIPRREVVRLVWHNNVSQANLRVGNVARSPEGALQHPEGATLTEVRQTSCPHSLTLHWGYDRNATGYSTGPRPPDQSRTRSMAPARMPTM